MNDNNIKQNIIRGHKLDGPFAEGDDDTSISEVEDDDAGQKASNRQRKKKDDLQLEFSKWKKPRSLLPTEVCSLLVIHHEDRSHCVANIFQIMYTFVAIGKDKELFHVYPDGYNVTNSIIAGQRDSRASLGK